MFDQQLAIVLADSPRLIQALVRVKGELLLRHFKFLGIILEHVCKGSLLASRQLVLHLFDISDAAFAGVAPL